MSMLLENPASDQLLAEVLEHEARETARLMAEYDPADEIEEFPSDPETWPAWTAADCWAPNDPEPFEPSEDDARWLAMLPPIAGGAPAGPADADLEEAAELAEWQSRLEQMHAVTDRDVQTVTDCG